MKLTHSIIGIAKIANWATRKFRITQADLFSGTGIEPARLSDPHALVSPQEETEFYKNLVVLCPSPDLAIKAGFQLTASCYGVWGLALQSCETLQAGIEMGMQYIDFTYTYNRIFYQPCADAGQIMIEENQELSDLSGFMVMRDTAAIVRLIYDGLKPKLPFELIEVTASNLANKTLYERMLHCPVKTGADRNAIHIKSTQLSQRLNQANYLTWRLCCEQLDALYEQRKLQPSHHEKVRRLLRQKNGEFQNMEQIARSLGISPRTLRDRLTAEGTSYKNILDNERKAIAQQLLKETSLTLDQIAEQLGYSDATSFSHACRRWFNKPPRRV